MGLLLVFEQAHAQTCPVTTLPKPIRIVGDYRNVSVPDAQGRTFINNYTYNLPATNWDDSPGTPIANANVGGATGTSSEELYRHTVRAPKLDWHIAVPNGTYQVLLHHSTISAVAGRILDITLNGTLVDAAYSPFAASGNTANAAVVKSYTTTVTNGDLSLAIEAATGSSFPQGILSGLEIIPLTLNGAGTLTINKTTVAGCYSVNGVSKATVSVEVGWANAVGPITVSYAGQTQTINPGGNLVDYPPYNQNGATFIHSPQVVSFEVDLSTTTSGQSVTATWNNAPSCPATSAPITLQAPCPPTTCAVNQTGGKVFNDFNADGVKNSGEYTGIAGVTVRAYDCNNQLVATATTDAFGAYSFTGLSASSYPISVEFANLPAYASMGTLNGVDGRTTVQFVNAPDCSIDLGVLNNVDYCQTNPNVI